MNIITRPGDQVTDDPASTKAEISPDERERRKAIVDQARGSVRLEGFFLTPFAEDLYGRYVDGELTLKEVGARILAHHGS
jgi:Antitoxin VbhA